MDYLLKYGFSNDDLEYIKEFYDDTIINTYLDSREEIEKKIIFLLSYGIININQVICANPAIVFYTDEMITKMFKKYSDGKIVDRLFIDPYIDYCDC